jgi:flavin-dependent dehydrogenase
MKKPEKNKLILEDGSRIAVLGGGPAGSFFTIFALDLASRMGLEITVDIYEAKSFFKTGPIGCNHCGGIVSESLVQALSAEGIILPSEVIRRGIETYTLHLEQGSTIIETIFQEQRIASMFRGAGPLGASDKTRKSFDGYLLGLCREKGAEIVEDKVVEARMLDDGVVLSTKNSNKQYDLLVGASGLNPKTLGIYRSLIPKFKPPKTTKTYICEYHLGNEKINQHFGDSMHVFLLNVAHIKFGALIPKGDYVTLVLLGDSIDKQVVESFINSTEVKACFPEDIDLRESCPCQCFPSINVAHAQMPYADRIVLIGDTSSSKLYKNGIGAAYITAKAAANTVIFDGISKKDFKRSFRPVCRSLDIDNGIGKLIFIVTTVIQKSSLLKRGLFRMVIEEQSDKSSKKRMSSVLWDTFTGSAPYTSILLRTVHPRVLIMLIWNIIVANLKPKKYEIK